MVPLDKGLQWLNVKQKPFRQVQAHSGIIRDIQKFFRHIQAYLKPCVTLTYLILWYIQNPDILEPEAYSEPRHIHNPDIFRTELYSECRHIQNLRHIQNPVKIYDEALIIFTAIIIFTNYNYFCKACQVEINIFRQFLQRLLHYVKKLWHSRGRWGL